MTNGPTDAPEEARRADGDHRDQPPRNRRRRSRRPRNGGGPPGNQSGEKPDASRREAAGGGPPVVAAIDLGTNNCRLLIASKRGSGFRVVDAFSRIVRLGEGVSLSGRLSDAAMQRTVDALRICADKIRRRGVTRVRCIATQACRMASNSDDFVARVREETGLVFEVISAEEEARLGLRGCASLLDPAVDGALVFDIGGGSTEVSWLDMRAWGAEEAARGRTPAVSAWLSIPMGVVSLHERFVEQGFGLPEYEAVAQEVANLLLAVDGVDPVREAFDAGRAHLLGTSGTVTSIAGVHLKLPSYDRKKVDGLWMGAAEARAVCDRLAGMTYDERVLEPCIGTSRAELVAYGCAIYEGVARAYPSERLRIADRGLREGVLAELFQTNKRRRGRRGGRKGRRPKAD
ncbi:MAG: Ppx/GppA phosphatase family protein [Pseudomonadota bacterium]